MTRPDGDVAALARRVAVLEARHEIERVIRLYGHAGDQRDSELLATAFHPGSTHIHSGVFEGLSADFAVAGIDALGVTESSSHYLSNVEISLDLDAGTAIAQCYFAAYHRVVADQPEGAFGGHHAGRHETKWVGGRYFDRFELRNGAWKIVHRTAVHDWEQWVDEDARGFVRDTKHVPDTTPYSSAS